MVYNEKNPDGVWYLEVPGTKKKYRLISELTLKIMTFKLALCVIHRPIV